MSEKILVWATPPVKWDDNWMQADVHFSDDVSNPKVFVYGRIEDLNYRYHSEWESTGKSSGFLVNGEQWKLPVYVLMML